MALVVKDRVKETTTTTGTGTISLGGAPTGFQTFVAGIGTTNTTYYAIVDNTTGDYEVGIGAVTDGSPDTLSRDTILESSNSGSAINLQSGTKDVFCTQPAEKAVYEDASGNVDVSGTVTADGLTVEGQVTIDTSTENALDILADSTNQTLLRLSHPTAPADAGGYFAFNSDGTTDNNVVTFGVEYSGTDYDVLNIQRSTQNVGIGTSNPSTNLDIVGGNDNTFDTPYTILLKGTDAYNSGNAGSGIVFTGEYNSSEASTTFATISGIKENLTDGNFTGALLFGTRKSSGLNIESMRLTSGGNLGIGDTSPSQTLAVQQTASGEVARFTTTDGGSGSVQGNASVGLAHFANQTHPPVLLESEEISNADYRSDFHIKTRDANSDSAPTTRVTVTSSGDLLVGTTSTTLYSATSGGGILAIPNSSTTIARQSTSSTQPLLILNETGVDGTLQEFRKDGTTVGSIDSFGGQPNINGGTSSGLSFGSSLIYPRGGNNTVQNGTVDLGNGSNRFKDLYLSGTAYIGGNAALTTADEGSGNGLDADTVDGIQGASFARTDSGVPDFQYGIQSADLYLGTDGDTDGDYNITLKTRVSTDILYLQAGNTGSVSVTNDLNVGGHVKTEGPDGGGVIRNWQADSNYVMFGTANMNSSEYAVLTNGTNTYISGGSGGATHLRGGDNDSSPQLVVDGDSVNVQSGAMELQWDSTDVLNFTANSTNDSRGISFNSRTALSADYNDGYLRLNQNSEFTNGVYTPGSFRASDNITAGDRVIAGGTSPTNAGQISLTGNSGISTSPYMSFHEGATRRAYIQYNIGGDYLFVYNEQASSVVLRGNATTAYTYFQNSNGAGGRMMAENTNVALQHDNGENIIYGAEDSHTWLYYNGDWRLRTEDNGIRIRSPSTYTYNQMIMETNGTVRGYVYANTSNQVGFLDSDGQWAVRVRRDTDVGFFVNNVEKFAVGSSSTTSANDITVNSDERIKDNVELIPNALEKVQAIRGVTFNRTDTDDDTRHAGVIAQEVEKVLPEVVTENEETGIKSVAYANMVGLLIEAVKEQQTQIDDLKAEVTRLKGFE